MILWFCVREQQQWKGLEGKSLRMSLLSYSLTGLVPLLMYRSPMWPRSPVGRLAMSCANDRKKGRIWHRSMCMCGLDWVNFVWIAKQRKEFWDNLLLIICVVAGPAYSIPILYWKCSVWLLPIYVFKGVFIKIEFLFQMLFGSLSYKCPFIWMSLFLLIPLRTFKIPAILNFSHLLQTTK